MWPSSAALEEGARWPAVRTTDEPASGKDGVERSGTEPPGRLTALRRGREILHFVQNDKEMKKPRWSWTIGASKKPQRLTLPTGRSVPSARLSLTSLFGMGRGGSSVL